MSRTVKECATVLLLAVMALASGRAQQNRGVRETQRQDAGKEVSELEHQFLEAYLHADMQTLDSLMDDDYLQIDIYARVQNKADWLHMVKNFSSLYPNFKLVSYETKDVRVRLFGNTALWTGIWTGKAMRDGNLVTQQIRMTSVWVKRKGEWRRVGYQATLVAQPSS